MKFATFGHPPSSVQQAAIVPSALASFDRLWAQIAVIGISTSFCNAIVYYPLRSGLENPHLLIPSCILVVTAALLAPLLLPYRGLMSDLRWRTVAMPILTFAVLGSVVFALVTQSFLFIFYVAICLVGASRAIQLLRPEGLANFIFCIFTGGLIGLYLFCTVQSLNYAGLYSPEQALLGTLNHDTTFHSALAFMIQNYGVPSIGMDGIVPLKYHFGSHFWFAGLGRLAATEPLFSYGAGVPIVLAPMLITSLFLSGASVDQGQRPLAGYLLIGIALVLLSDNIGWQSYYISESYTCGADRLAPPASSACKPCKRADFLPPTTIDGFRTCDCSNSLTRGFKNFSGRTLDSRAGISAASPLRFWDPICSYRCRDKRSLSSRAMENFSRGQRLQGYG